MNTTPTVLLVHGAFADGSSWAPVLTRLLDAGITARAIANPLRGLHEDSAYVASVAQRYDGPVLLVGHSYGGAVISSAGTQAENVAGLVFVAAFGLEKGESMAGSVATYDDLGLGGALEPHPLDGGELQEFTLAVDKFGPVFAADVDESIAATAAVSQRPTAAPAFGEELTVEPAWKTLPSWYAVASEDRALHPDAQRMFAERVGAHTTEIAGSHSIALSQPDKVAALIVQAAESVTLSVAEQH